MCLNEIVNHLGQHFLEQGKQRPRSLSTAEQCTQSGATGDSVSWEEMDMLGGMKLTFNVRSCPKKSRAGLDWCLLYICIDIQAEAYIGIQHRRWCRVLHLSYISWLSDMRKAVLGHSDHLQLSQAVSVCTHCPPSPQKRFNPKQIGWKELMKCLASTILCTAESKID